MKKTTMLILLSLLISSFWAAVGCDLNDPDKDVKRLFSGSTSYKTSYRSIQREGGKVLLTKIESQLGDKFGGLFETIDVPYTLYEIYKGKTKLGYIHGVNQKGYYGGIQVFLSMNNKGLITNMYFQKFSSKKAKLYKDAAFTRQFVGLSLKDFSAYDVHTGKGSGKAAVIKDPSKGVDPDFLAIMRGVKKNLVLMDHFGTWNK